MLRRFQSRDRDYARDGDAPKGILLNKDTVGELEQLAVQAASVYEAVQHHRQ